MRKSLGASLALMIALYSLLCFPALADERTPPRLFLELRDGSLLSGQTDITAVNLDTTSCGKVQINLPAIASIEFTDGRDTAVVNFRNGDRLTGVPELKAIAVRNDAGAVTKPVPQIKRLGVLTGPPFNPNVGLVAYWPFTGSANDESGKGNALRVQGATLAKDRFGRAQRAYHFDGVDDYAGVPQAAGLDGAEAFTVSAWVRADAVLGRRGYVVRQGNAMQGKYRFGLDVNPPGWVIFNTHDQMNWHGASGPGAAAGRWCHLVGVYDGPGKQMRLHIDGRLAARVDNPRINPARGEPLVIGAEVYQRVENFFAGDIDDVRLYNRALSAEEVLQLHVLESAQPRPPGPATPPPAAGPPATGPGEPNT